MNSAFEKALLETYSAAVIQKAASPSFTKEAATELAQAILAGFSALWKVHQKDQGTDQQ